jgi:transposase
MAFTIFIILTFRHITVKLPQEEKIKKLHRSYTQRKHADKLKTTLLLADGFSCMNIGNILLLDDGTIRTYRNTYLNEGVASLLNDNNKGASSLLNPKLDALNKHLTEHVCMDSKGIVDWVNNEFGISDSPTGINALLKRLGLVYKKLILTACRDNLEKQEEFVKQYQELKENPQDKSQIYFMDGVHPQHNSIAHYGWIKKRTNKTFKNQ